MKKLFSAYDIETSSKTNTLRISRKIKEISKENRDITDGDAWKYLTDLCRARITCHGPEEVKKAFLELQNFNMQKDILKIEPRFNAREHDVVIVFNYFHIMICELEIKLHHPYPI